MPPRLPAALYACVFELPAGLPVPTKAWERGRTWRVEWRSVGIPPVGFDDAPAHVRFEYVAHGIDAAEGKLLVVLRVRALGSAQRYEARYSADDGSLQSVVLLPAEQEPSAEAGAEPPDPSDVRLPDLSGAAP